MQLWLDLLPSPVGELSLVSDEQGALRALEFDSNDERLHRLLGRHYREYRLAKGRASALVREALEAYFAGDPSHLDAVPVATGGTEFQRLVWQALRRIPAGTTISYGELAARIGRPGASRAVGLANGANPVSIVVPCHRVIGANGTLTGYGGGLARKRWLVEHERGHVQGELFSLA
ncbi:methylated-DNA--[protein]-cysteine S-methyltransferase [Billgrantia tianxiuensis]|uniref:Methylated-DNA--protein-cysteine methyltransferase n=1 Tax=Billgrantia tianxiuensis TaxID=2497861 RepID=A0A6I6SMI7_9GAMM|nr:MULTISPECIES: methylated-DNA--[protein]-cysteine S-methyltransferase [Halomonas]MCE8033357.1 methylated-DNA--[protein]-cysteine S-methyltransferase [Halomonas sp. MCCC 1A11057]QHC49080.1 methylated-DNA--[protein]-cysteine S-methyltransferase [Halomonas tianxiuensis]